LNTAACLEDFISASEAQKTTDATQSVILGHSVLRIPVATASECEQLLQEARSAADNEFEACTRPSAKYGATTPTRIRMPVVNFLEPSELALCDRLLRRTLAGVTDTLPTLVAQQMGSADKSSRQAILGNAELMFSDGEPAINVYRAGGLFKAHEDKMNLTVLMPLCDSAGGAFTGGGTAFWSLEDCGPDRLRAQTAPPTLTVHAPAGTALVFVGSVTHGALPVLSGERAVFVASFGPQLVVKRQPASSAARLLGTWREFMHEHVRVH